MSRRLTTPSFYKKFSRWLFAAVFLSHLIAVSTHTYASTIHERLFDRVGQEELPTSIKVVAQDRQGFLWLGTKQGLARYDGYDFRFFVHSRNDPSSLSGNYVQALWAADDGRLWVGTRTGGLSVFDPGTETFSRIRHEPTDPESLPNNRINTIVGDQQGFIWVGTHGGLTRIASQTGAMKHFRNQRDSDASIRHNRVRALVIEANGDVLVGHNEGVDRLGRISETFQPLIPSTVDGESLNNVLVNGLEVIDGDTEIEPQIWVATNTGLGLVDRDNELHMIRTGNAGEGLYSDVVTGFLRVDRTELWVATRGGGISVVDLLKQEITQTFHRDVGARDGDGAISHTNHMFKDTSGLLWVAKTGAGLMRYNPSSRVFRPIRRVAGDTNSLSSNNISYVLQRDNGDIWVAYRDRAGLDILDADFRRKRNVSIARGELPGEIRVMVEDRAGTVWLGVVNQGLYRYRDDRFESTEIGRDTKVFALYSENKNLWVGSDEGLIRLDTHTSQITSYNNVLDSDELMSKTVEFIDQGGDGTLWLASSQAVYALPKGAARLVLAESYNYETSTRTNDEIIDLNIGVDNRIWVVTRRGVELLSNWDGESLDVESVNRNLGLPENRIMSFLSRDQSGNMWSAEGFIDAAARRYVPLSKVDGVFVGNPRSRCTRGLVSNYMVFCGSGGLLAFDPAQFEAWSYDAPLVATELKINGVRRPLPETSNLVLSPDALSFTLEYSVLDYSAPRFNRYAFRLGGFEEQWHEVDYKRRYAHYTNLAPGNYLLEIEGRNRVGTKSSDSYTLNVVVLPHWYQTGMFKVLATVTVLLILFLIYFLRIRVLKRQERLLAQQVAERTREVSEKNVALQESHVKLQESNTKLEQTTAYLQEISNRDELTGLFNRRYLMMQVAQDVAIVHRRYHNGQSEGADLVFMLLDIDFFKKVNDRHGHDAGDVLLKAFADLLRALTRETDTVVRWGGEEFLIVMRLTSLAQAETAAERIRSAIESHRFTLSEALEIKVTCSIGYASYPTFKQTPPESLAWQDTLKIADVALFLAKQSSRNTYVGFHARAGAFSRENFTLIVESPAEAIRRKLVDFVAPAATRERVLGDLKN